jgi:hypothetical protein
MVEIEKDYFVDMEGRVYSKRKFNTLTELKQHKTGHKGYVKVRISRKNQFVHRLVAIAYLENPENKETVNHIDGNKENNHVNNLEWCTRSENSQHAYDLGLHKPYTDIKDHGNNKFADEWLKLVNQGVSMRELGRLNCVSHKTISRTINKFNNLKNK